MSTTGEVNVGGAFKNVGGKAGGEKIPSVSPYPYLSLSLSLSLYIYIYVDIYYTYYNTCT